MKKINFAHVVSVLLMAGFLFFIFSGIAKRNKVVEQKEWIHQWDYKYKFVIPGKILTLLDDLDMTEAEIRTTQHHDPWDSMYFVRPAGGYYVASNGKWYIAIPPKLVREATKEESLEALSLVEVEYVDAKQRLRREIDSIRFLDVDDADFRPVYKQMFSDTLALDEPFDLPDDLVRFMQSNGIPIESKRIELPVPPKDLSTAYFHGDIPLKTTPAYMAGF